MSLQKIDVISLPVSEQERSKKFYAALGFETVMDYPTGPQTRWVQIALPGAQTSLALVTEAQTLPDGMKLGAPGSSQGMTIATTDLDGTQKLLAEAGVTAPIQTAAWGRYLTFVDPDGNAWLVSEPKK